MSHSSSDNVEYILLQTISEYSEPIGAGFLADTLHGQGVSSASEATVGRYLRRLENEGYLISQKYDGRSRGRTITPLGHQRLCELIAERQQHKTMMDTIELFRNGFGEQLRNMLVTRAIIEPEVAALAARNATQADITECGESMAKTDAPFHIAVARATGNPVLEAVMQMIRADRDYSPEIERIINTSSLNSSCDHLHIYNAIAQGNEDEARHIMKGHIENLIQQCNQYETRTKTS